MRQTEDRLWWFAAVHANVLRLYRRLAPDGRLLDAGCGTGGLLARLAREHPDSAAVGLDASETACRWAMDKSGRPVCRGSVDTLPFDDGAFAAIVSVDVLCHRGVDERRALEQFQRCLTAGGILIVNLPAYRWLMSRHDAAVYNARRYTRRQVLRLLRAAGLQPVFASYWNMLLFPAMVVTRKLLPGGGSDVRRQPAMVDALCRAATGVERGLFAAGLRLPFGGSILAVAAKAEATND
ncbi:MAG: class I SAM-dependent methyltransferase [Alphaproteobacteria bacterium]|nr:class I SAM-dependent methyltransferase [Alphaproteobacteria bacterium]